MSPKAYDQAYFDRWYRDPRHRVHTDTQVARKVHLALSTAEFLLGRPVRRVLDVGCGEGRWQPILRRLRPRARYLGLDPSEYAVARFGKRRNIRLGTFGALEAAGLDDAYDLIVAADVIHYVDDADLARGLASIARRLTGLAYLEAYVREDEIEGDLQGWRRREERSYRRAIRRAGLVPVGPHCYVTAEFARELARLECPAGQG